MSPDPKQKPMQTSPSKPSTPPPAGKPMQPGQQPSSAPKQTDPKKK
jgi:hypothetical protein